MNTDARAQYFASTSCGGKMTNREKLKKQNLFFVLKETNNFTNNLKS